MNTDYVSKHYPIKTYLQKHQLVPQLNIKIASLMDLRQHFRRYDQQNDKNFEHRRRMLV